MKSGKYFQWKGFEFTPEGCLLDQVIDLSTDMGVAYERSCGFYKDFHYHERLMLIFPRENCKMEVTNRQTKITHKIDCKTLLIVPSQVEHDDLGTGAIYDTLALYPSPQLITKISNQEGLKTTELNRFKSEIHKLKKSQWLEQLIQQYFFQRLIARKNDQLRFLEEAILSEVFGIYLGTNLQAQINRFDFQNDEGVSERAIRYIETNLFNSLSLETIAKNANTSVSTLLRQFKLSVSKTPYAYIKERRMTEAMNLIKSGHYNVSEVATLTGYNNFGAFSEAFRSFHKKPPSFFLKSKKI